MNSSTPAVTEVLVISGTHWDREWYQNFQGFRFRLVRLLDKVLDLLAKNPAWGPYHLDGQTSLLADYLQIRPERETEIRRFISEGRLIAGPWMTMPDLWLVDFESVFRNLEEGTRQAERLGGSAKDGWVCDLFGFPSQTPQIFARFGIGSAFLFRGTTDATHPADFWWTAPDGSQVLCHRFSEAGGYCEFYSSVLAQERGVGLPFDLEASTRRAVPWLESLVSASPVAMVADMADHSDPEARLPELLAAINRSSERVRIRSGTLSEYLNACRAASSLSEVKGELREPAVKLGTPTWLISETLSSHATLKRLNRKIEILLLRQAEPLAALSAVCGTSPAPLESFLREAWRETLLNHAHDSICGCSIDAVHRDMIGRFHQAEALAGEVVRESLKSLRITSQSADPNDISVAVFNSQPASVLETFEFEVDLPKTVETVNPNDIVDRSVVSGYPQSTQGFFGEKIPALAVYDDLGSEIPCAITGILRNAIRREQVDGAFPVVHEFDRITLVARTKLPALGLAHLQVKPRLTQKHSVTGLMKAPGRLSTEYFDLHVSDRGVDLRLPGQEHSLLGRLIFEDTGENGDGWFSSQPVRDHRVLASHPCGWAVKENNPLRAVVNVRFLLQIPQAFEPDRTSRRSPVMESLVISVDFVVCSGQPWIGMNVEFENHAHNHRLRLFFESAAPVPALFTLSPAMLEQRSTTTSDYCEGKEWSDAIPSAGLTAWESSCGGLAVFHPGIYETVATGEGFGMTLLRGFHKTIMTDGETLGQDLGSHVIRLALRPFAGALPRVDLLRELSRFEARPLAVSSLPGQISESRCPSFLTIDGPMILSSLRHESGKILVRGWNPEAVDGVVSFRVGIPIKEAIRIPVSGMPGAAIPCVDGAFSVPVGPHEIVQIELPFTRPESLLPPFRMGCTALRQALGSSGQNDSSLPAKDHRMSV